MSSQQLILSSMRESSFTMKYVRAFRQSTSCLLFWFKVWFCQTNLLLFCSIRKSDRWTLNTRKGGSIFSQNLLRKAPMVRYTVLKMPTQASNLLSKRWGRAYWPLCFFFHCPVSKCARIAHSFFPSSQIALKRFSSEEVGAWSALRSPRVVELFGVVREGPNVLLFMDLKSGKHTSSLPLIRSTFFQYLLIRLGIVRCDVMN